MHHPIRLSAGICALLLGLSIVTETPADPPDWAPAHGHRHKHGKHHDDDYYEERRPPPQPIYVQPPPRIYNDYGVKSGRCDSHAVAKVVGGAAGGALGGALGSQATQGSDAGTIVGAVAGTILGVIVGEQIGRSMDPTDSYCTGRVLDYAPDHRTVNWTNPSSRIGYVLTPQRSYRFKGKECRDFTTQMKFGSKHDSVRRTACKTDSGDWQLR